MLGKFSNLATCEPFNDPTNLMVLASKPSQVSASTLTVYNMLHLWPYLSDTRHFTSLALQWLGRPPGALVFQ